MMNKKCKVSLILIQLIIIGLCFVSCQKKEKFLNGYDFSNGNWTLLHQDNYGWGEMICNELILDSLREELLVKKDCDYTTPEYILSLYLNDSLVSSHWYCSKASVLKGALDPLFLEANRVTEKFKTEQDVSDFIHKITKSECSQITHIDTIHNYPSRIYDKEADNFSITYYKIENE